MSVSDGPIPVLDCSYYDADECCNSRNDSGQCSPYVCPRVTALRKKNRALEEANKSLRDVLRMVEWEGIGEPSKDGCEEFCPWCKRYRDGGHAPDCPRQKALGEVNGNSRGRRKDGAP